MTTLSFIGVILVIIGFVLKLQSICVKIGLNAGIGWGLSTAGMLLLSYCGFLDKSLFYAILCLIFAMGNLYFCITSIKD